MRDSTPLIEDWELLMSRIDAQLTQQELNIFKNSPHLFAKNDLVDSHNLQMLKALNVPIAQSIVESNRQTGPGNPDDDQLEHKVLLCKQQKIMLIANLWVDTGLVNGATRTITDIVYDASMQPLALPLFVVVKFDKYNDPCWDPSNPLHIPIPPISRGNRRQFLIKMAWGLFIHKLQELTLHRATINIGTTERKGLTFIAFSRVPSLANMCISPTFSFERYSNMAHIPTLRARRKEEVAGKLRTIKFKGGRDTIQHGQKLNISNEGKASVAYIAKHKAEVYANCGCVIWRRLKKWRVLEMFIKPFKGQLESVSLRTSYTLEALIDLTEETENEKHLEGRSPNKKQQGRVGAQGLYTDQGIKHLAIPTRDYLFAPSFEDIQRAVDFIHENAICGKTTYVHCKAGRGRSTTIVLCYLVKYKQMTPDDAYAYVRSKRPRVLLAASQWKAVQDYTKRIKQKQTELTVRVRFSLPEQFSCDAS
ncbi:hypothetical protein KI387_013079, partial [Taxus chinensis]